MKKARKSLGILPVLVITMMTAFFAFSGIAGRLPLIGGVLGSVEVYADTDPESGDEVNSDFSEQITIKKGQDNAKYYKFTPTEKGVYEFFSNSDEQDSDAQILIYDSDTHTYSEKHRDGSGDKSFYVVFEAEAGTTYYLKAYLHMSNNETDDNDYTFGVSLKKIRIEDISFSPKVPYEFYEGLGEKRTDSESKEYEYWELPNPLFRTGDELTLVINGAPVTYIFNLEDFRFYNKKDPTDYIDAGKVSPKENQHDKHWEKNGSHNEFSIIYNTYFSCTVPITITNSPVTDIKFTPVKEYELVENEDGHFNSWDSKFYYDNPIFREGDRLTVERGEGNKKDYSFDSNDWMFVAGDGDYIMPWGSTGCQILYVDTSTWTLGESNSFTVEYLGKQDSVTVKIIKSPVTKIEFEPSSPYVFSEDETSPTQDIKEGDKLTVTRSDKDEPIVYTAGWRPGFGYIFINLADENDWIYGYKVEIKPSLPWTLGSEKVVITYMGKTYEVDATIVSEDTARTNAVTAANKLLAEVDALNPSDYVDFSSVKSSRNHLDDLIKDDTTTARDIMNAIEYLEAQLAYLTTKEEAAREDALAKARVTITIANSLKETDYSKDSYKALADAVSNLKAIMGEDASTTEQIKVATAAVYDAQAALKTVEEERTEAVAAANDAITEAEAKVIEEDKYTKDSYSALETALNNLKTIVAETASTTEQIKVATKALKDAISGLVTKEQEAQKRAEAVNEANKAIAKAKALIASEYTTDSFDAVTAALSALEALIADSTADSTKINAGTAVLTSAIDNLQKVAQPPTNPTVKQSQPMKVTAKNKAFKANKLKKKKAIFKAITVKNAQGSVTYTVKGNKKSTKALKFNKKNGKITVRKGTKKGKYVLKITVNAAGNELYEAGTKTVKVTVKVK